ncbi:MAG: sigma-70 family RNA polymerase sigma factor [Steroidobacteraceae bacterium]
MADADQRPALHCDAGAASFDSSAEAAKYLFREHNDALVGYLTSRLRSAQEAKEVAQEAYLRVLQLQKGGTSSLFRAYLFKIAANLAIDRLRHRTIRRRAEQGELSEDPAATRGESNDPAARLLAQERTSQLLGYLEELPPKCRRVFSLHRLDGLAQHEVAASVGLSERMVRRYVTYVMVYCRLRLEGMAIDQIQRKISL